MSNNRNPKPTPDLAPDLSALQIRLIEEFQRDFPTTPRPFATIAEKIGSDEESVITAISDMKTKGGGIDTCRHGNSARSIGKDCQPRQPLYRNQSQLRT